MIPDDAGTALERVTDALDAAGSPWTRRPSGISTRCLVHDDSNPSVSINYRDGRVLILCHAGCATGDVLAALGLTFADLFDDRDGPVTPTDTQAVYPYSGAEGQRIGAVIRRGGKRGKAFYQVSYTDEGWTPKATEALKTTLYGLPAVLATAKVGGTVLVVEGEADADALAAHGHVATTNAGGAGKWRDEHTAALRGANVVVVADADAPGRKHAAQVADSVRTVAESVRIVEAASGKDTRDHLAAGYGVEDFVEQPGAAAPIERRVEWNALELMSATFAETRWAVAGLIADGLTLLIGAPKLGKSWLALAVARAVAAGGKVMGRIDAEPGDVLYLALEDPPRRLQSRLRLMLNGSTAPSRLWFYTEWRPLPDGGADDLRHWLDEHSDTRLIVIDVFAKVRGSTSDRANRYDADYAAMSELKRVADDYGVAVLVIHHTRKARSEDFVGMVSGTQGIAGAADAVLMLARERNAADGVLKITGRDVEEAEYALRFDAERGAWQMLDGPVTDYAMHDTRRRIIAHVREHGPVTPKDVAEALELKPDATRQTMTRMVKADQLSTDGQGHYTVPVTAVTGVTQDRHERGSYGESDTNVVPRSQHRTNPDQGKHRGGDNGDRCDTPVTAPGVTPSRSCDAPAEGLSQVSRLDPHRYRRCERCERVSDSDLIGGRCRRCAYPPGVESA